MVFYVYCGKPVDGVTIGFLNVATGTVEAEQVTDIGQKRFKPLPDGSYQIRQTKFKAGYVIDRTTHNVTFTGIASGNNDHQIKS